MLTYIHSLLCSTLISYSLNHNLNHFVCYRVFDQDGIEVKWTSSAGCEDLESKDDVSNCSCQFKSIYMATPTNPSEKLLYLHQATLELKNKEEKKDYIYIMSCFEIKEILEKLENTGSDKKVRDEAAQLLKIVKCM